MFKKLRNLWRLSDYRPLEVGEKTSSLPTGSTVVQALVKETKYKPKMATIINLEETPDDFQADESPR